MARSKKLALSVVCILGFLLYYTGLWRIVKLLNRKVSKVLLYHDVARSETETLFASEISTTIPIFLKQLNFLLTYYRVVPLEDVENGVRGNNVAITFDDGFSSVLTNAIPILRTKGISSTVFLITRCCGGDFIPERHAELMRAHIAKEEAGEGRDDANERSRRKVGDRGEDALPSSQCYSSSRLDPSDVYIDWQDITTSDSISCVDWQSHTHNHHDFSRTNLEVGIHDVSVSLQEIGRRTGCAVKRLALPFGRMPKDSAKFLQKMVALGIETIYLAGGTSKHERIWLHDGSICIVDRIQLRGSSDYQLFTELEILPHLRRIFGKFYKDS